MRSLSHGRNLPALRGRQRIPCSFCRIDIPVRRFLDGLVSPPYIPSRTTRFLTVPTGGREPVETAPDRSLGPSERSPVFAEPAKKTRNNPTALEAPRPSPGAIGKTSPPIRFLVSAARRRLAGLIGRHRGHVLGVAGNTDDGQARRLVTGRIDRLQLPLDHFKSLCNLLSAPFPLPLPLLK